MPNPIQRSDTKPSTPQPSVLPPSTTTTPTPATTPSLASSDPVSPDPLATELQRLQSELHDAHQVITRLERRHRIDDLLRESQAVDLDAARLLTEATIAQMNTSDVEMVVQDLRRHKPWLFRQTQPQATAMGQRNHASASVSVDEAAKTAATTGHRRDLLRYLRLRRQ